MAAIPRPLELLIVEDDAPFAGALAALFDADDRVEISGIACDSRAAIDQVSERHFDLALVDVRLGHASGFGAVAAMLGLDADLVILMMSGLDTDEFSPQAHAAGAHGVVQKSSFMRGGADVVVDAYAAAVAAGS
jgi:DNA-binding NarL/FixJ family response regulator